VVGRDRISTPLGNFDAFRVVPSVAYLSDGKLKEKAHNTVLWVSADARHLPLRIESAVFIGSVRIDLVKILEAPHPGAPPPAPRGASADERSDVRG